MKTSQSDLLSCLANLAIKAVICVVLGVVSVSASSAATLIWGGVQHRTGPDAIEYDTLDVGISSAATTLAGMTLTVTGPSGFIDTFTDADIIPSLNGQLALQKKYPTATDARNPGAYTFTLDDGPGQISQRVDTHVTVAQALARVDSATIQTQRKADGSYRISWAPLNDTRTYFYRLRIDNIATNRPVYFSKWEMTALADLTVSPAIIDNTSYRVRVEVSDSADFDTATNCSYSAFVNFNPIAADYDSGRLLFDFTSAYNRIDPVSGNSTAFGFLVDNPGAINSAVLTGPGGFSYAFDLVSDKLASNEFWKKFTTALQTGTYRFDILANGRTDIHNYAYATLTSPVVYPFPDATTYQGDYVNSENIQFSWADVNYSGALYYRVSVNDSVTNKSFLSPVINQTYVIPNVAAVLSEGSLADKTWQVEVLDSPSATTRRNLVAGTYSSSNLAAIPLFDAGRPAFNPLNGLGIYNDVLANGTSVANIWMGATDADGSIVGLRVDGPGGYSRNLLTAGKPDGDVYRRLEAGAPAAGLYTFTAVGNDDKTIIRSNYQPASVQLLGVDFRSIKVFVDGSNTVFSWAPVDSTLPLWYSIQFLADADVDNNGEPDSIAVSGNTVGTGKSSVTVASSALSSVKYFRIFAADGSKFTTINNRSRSAIVGYEPPGFDYSTLSNVDGDAYASNADANDSNPAIFPFAAPTITANFTPADGTIYGVCDPIVFTSTSTGPITAYSWLINGVTTPGSTFTASSLAPGSYQVTLTVTNSATGEIARLTRTVTVINHAPTVTSTGGPYNVLPAGSLNLAGTGADTDTCSTLSYAWDVDNNGSYEYLTANPIISYSDLQTLLGVGSHSMSFKVTDSNGGIATAVATLIVHGTPTGTVQINGGAATTFTPAVSLALTATGANGVVVTHMRFSQDDGLTWLTGWETYAPTRNITLLPNGSISVQYKDANGLLSAVITDTIIIDTNVKVKIDGVVTPYYLIDSALDDILVQGKTVRARDQIIIDAVTMTSPVIIVLKGGYSDTGFTSQPAGSYTTIAGSMKIRSGTLKVDRLKIK